MSGKNSICVIELIKRHLQEDEILTISSLGGISMLTTQMESLAVSPFLDVLACLAVKAQATESVEMDRILLEGFTKCQAPTVFRSAINIVITQDFLRQRISTQLASILEQRIDAQHTERESLTAAYALEGLLRLALDRSIKKFIPLKVLTCSRPNISGLYAQHAAKLAGVAYNQWSEPDLKDTLIELSKIESAEGEAYFELALVTLSEALNSDSLEEVIQLLEQSSSYLQNAQIVDENRADATAYAAVIEIIRGFHLGKELSYIEKWVETLSDAIRSRTMFLDRQYLPDWLVPRIDREIQWARLIRSIQKASNDLTRPSWLKAISVIENLLFVFDADRTFGTKGGLSQLLRPNIEASFVRERGQLAILDELLEEPEWEQNHKTTAITLRSRITQLVESEDFQGKLLPEGCYPKLQEILRFPHLPPNLSPEVMQRLEIELNNRTSSLRNISNPIIQRLLTTIISKLELCQDYIGDVRTHFNELLVQIALFCKTRQDGGSKELRDRGNYLRDPAATEFELQQDLWQWLSGNYSECEILGEVEGIGTGRADLFATFGGHRFVLEMKRHRGHVDRTTAKQYCDQAATYQNTNVKLGFLGILELSNRSGPPPSLEECIWLETVLPENSNIIRHLIVFRVIGNLKTPSSMSITKNRPKKNK